MKQKEYKDNNKDTKGKSSSKVFANMNSANDECYTRREEADKMTKYLKEKNIIPLTSKIWLPFNDNGSAIYESLKAEGFTNLYAPDSDFYKEKCEFDIIISNPPFSKRTMLFNKLMELNKPFILIQPAMLFNNANCDKILCQKSKDWGFLMPEKRMSFILNGKDAPAPAFYSFWLCYKTKIKGFNLLPTPEQRQEGQPELSAKKSNKMKKTKQIKK